MFSRPGLIRCLSLEEPTLAVDAQAIAREFSVLSDNTVTRNRHGDIVSRTGRGTARTA